MKLVAIGRETALLSSRGTQMKRCIPSTGKVMAKFWCKVGFGVMIASCITVYGLNCIVAFSISVFILVPFFLFDFILGLGCRASEFWRVHSQQLCTGSFSRESNMGLQKGLLLGFYFFDVLNYFLPGWQFVNVIFILLPFLRYISILQYSLYFVFSFSRSITLLSLPPSPSITPYLSLFSFLPLSVYCLLGVGLVFLFPSFGLFLASPCYNKDG
ncbi:hypothetical protein BDD12DRAFT_375242 [Trichophaea hybrida]|nr:hypothetical protein BDD12DRAFT_375242 [Trichophaea hybrida]